MDSSGSKVNLGELATIQVMHECHNIDYASAEVDLYLFHFTRYYLIILVRNSLDINETLYYCYQFPIHVMKIPRHDWLIVFNALCVLMDILHGVDISFVSK
jgi:hypothetical protein